MPTPSGGSLGFKGYNRFMRREDGPEGEIIIFDSFDRARYRQLGESVSLDDLPVLFDGISGALQTVNHEVEAMPAYNRKRGDLLVRSTMLSQLLEEMLDVAGEEIIEAQLAKLT